MRHESNFPLQKRTGLLKKNKREILGIFFSVPNLFISTKNCFVSCIIWLFFILNLNNETLYRTKETFSMGFFSFHHSNFVFFYPTNENDSFFFVFIRAFWLFFGKMSYFSHIRNKKNVSSFSLYTNRAWLNIKQYKARYTHTTNTQTHVILINSNKKKEYRFKK